VWAAAAIYCALFDSASCTKTTVISSQNEHRGKFCPFPMINVTLWATQLIQHTLVGRLIPPLRRNTMRIGAPQSQLTLISIHWWYYISFCTQFSPAYVGLDCHRVVEFHTVDLTPRSPFHTPVLIWANLNPCRCSLALIWHYSILIGTTQPRCGSLFHPVPLQHLPCTFLFHTALPILTLCLSWVVAPLFYLSDHCLPITHWDSQLANISVHLC
jgi:hypothetical protein